MYKLSIVSFAALLVTLLPQRLWAGSKVTVGAKVARQQQVSLDEIDHTAWDELLKKYCDDRGFVDYRGWKASTADGKKLDQYLAHLSSGNPSLQSSRGNQFAFWINAYNAVTVKGILREYPTTSIRNHTARLVGYNIWHDLLLPVGEETYSLDQIEHKVLRPMGDSRIHFAIVCASIGCPPLLNEAYLGEKLNDQLDHNAKQFFADPEKFAATSRGELKLSQILKWFPEDFGDDQSARLRTIARFLPTPAARSLALSGKARVSYLEYDWGLNDQAVLSK